MDNQVVDVPIETIKIRSDLYPRYEHNQQTAQRYAECISFLPPIELNQNNELIDGKHRIVAHKLKNLPTIKAVIIETKSDIHLLLLSQRRNNAHGLQLNENDKKRMAQRLYIDEATWCEFSESTDRAQVKKDIAKELSWSLRLVQEATSNIDSQKRSERKATILNMYIQCYTAQEIADVVGMELQTIVNEIGLITKIEEDSKKVITANFNDDFKPPIYNLWSFGKTTNKTEHFGQTEQRIVDNLIYLYTKPFDIVLDPFSGGGSSLDVCEFRSRRCYSSDRKPKPGLENKIRTLDIVKELPELNNRWSDVTLTYLDPPYWKQAENKYSSDAEDLANYESSDSFHTDVANIIKRIAKKQSKGVIALIIQPTQWKSENKEFIDHVLEITKQVNNKNLVLENRISCPYQSEQYLPQMVNWAKENKKLLVLTRELIVWRFI
jgi:DNA modification methylase